MNALRLSLTWLTVLPIRGPSVVDRRLGGRAITLAPLVGVLLGAAAGVLWCVACLAGASPLVSALIVVTFLAVATRAMHLDGLADTFDGLGTYGPPERAREVMKSGPVGPFGVVAIVLAMGLQAASFAHLEPVTIALAVTAGRVAAVGACLRVAASPVPAGGLGSLVASTQPPWIVAAWTTALAITCVFVNPLAPLVILGAAVIAALLVRHCVRRLGAVNGDVLGAVIEVTVTVVAVGLSLF